MPIQIRYGDIDAQWHVNNARFISFMELARFRYITELGLWDGKSFLDLGLIVADTHISYLLPVKLDQEIKIGIHASRIGNKSLTFSYKILDTQSNQTLATAETVMVSFDYRTQTSIPVPQKWRDRITQYEGVDYTDKNGIRSS